MQIPKTFDNLIDTANTHQLYKKLIHQLNKDFLYANIDLKFDENISPDNMKKELHRTVYDLIEKRFADYLNLLYVIDVSEEKIKQLKENDSFRLSEKVTFLILLREWQKVWFKKQYSQK